MYVTALHTAVDLTDEDDIDDKGDTRGFLCLTTSAELLRNK